MIGVGDQARIGGGREITPTRTTARSRRDGRGDQRLAVADVAHQDCAVGAAIRAAFSR